MEQKRFSPFEALVFGTRAFIDNLRLFGLTYLLVGVVTFAVIVVLALINMNFFKEVGMMIYAHMEAGNFGADAPAGSGLAIAKELWIKVLEYKVMIGLSLLAFLLYISGIVAGYAVLYLEVYDTGTSQPKRVLGSFKHTLTLFMASLLGWSGIILGFILFIVPGLYLAFRWSLFSFFIVDRNAGIIQSLRMSWDATRGQVWLLASFSLAQVLMVKLGLIGIFLGSIYILAYAYAYRKLATRL